LLSFHFKRELKKGSSELFVAPLKDLGRLTAAAVWNDKFFWKLKKVTIKYVDNDRCVYTAKYNWVQKNAKKKNLSAKSC